MNNVVEFKTAHNPDHVLQQAVGDYETVLIIGWDHNGGLDARASTNVDKRECLWLVQQFTHKLMNGDYTSE